MQNPVVNPADPTGMVAAVASRRKDYWTSIKTEKLEHFAETRRSVDYRVRSRVRSLQDPETTAPGDLSDVISVKLPHKGKEFVEHAYDHVSSLCLYAGPSPDWDADIFVRTQPVPMHNRLMAFARAGLAKNRGKSAAFEFVNRDGDHAIGHRIRAFLLFSRDL